MVRVLRFICVLAALAAAASTASLAFAAPATWESVDVTLHADEPGRSVLIVSGELPAATPLPAEVELSVPAGAQVGWIGEILGGPPEKDRQLQYARSAANGADVYKVTLTTSRVAQVEAALTGVETFDGSTYGTSLKWVPSQDVPSVRISARLKQGAQIAQASPGASLVAGDAGYVYYSKTVKDVKAGSPVELAFTYALSSAGQSGSASGASGSEATTALVAVLAVLAGAAIVIGARRKRARQGTEGEASAPQEAAEGGAEADVESDSVEDSAEVGAEPARRRGVRAPAVIAAVVVAGIFVGIVAIEGRPTPPAFVDGKLSRSFGSTTACTVVSIPLAPNEGVDLAVSGGKLMDALEGLPSLGDVTVYLDPPSIDVGYCESSLTEEAVREALASAGIVTLGASVTRSAEPATGTAAP